MKIKVTTLLLIYLLVACRADDIDPFLSIDAPANLSIFTQGDTIIIYGKAIDDANISSVRFLNIDLGIDQSVEAEADSKVFDYRDSLFLGVGLPKDTFEITVRAVDGADNVVENVISIIVE